MARGMRHLDPSDLNPDELRDILADLKSLGVSHNNIAGWFGYKSKATVHQWLTGATKIPEAEAKFLRNLRQWWVENSIPCSMP